MSMVLEVRDLHKTFRHPWTLKKIPVLRGIDFTIEKNAIVGFLGGNGAGKTTSIKCILGLLGFEQGSVKIFEKDCHNIEVKNLIGYLPERPYFYRYLSAHEFLTFYGRISTSLGRKDLDIRIDELLELVGLSEAKNSLLKQFSKGMLQRIGMAQALIHRPRFLILDEPLSGLDPDGRMQMASVIQTAFDLGTTIFFSSHLLDDVDRMCQDLVVIRGGKISYCGAKEGFVSQKAQNYALKYRLENQVFDETLASLSEVQQKIDQLRAKNVEILMVDRETLSLEQAYKDFHGLELR